MTKLVDDDHPLFERIPRMLGFAALADYIGELVPSSVRGYYLKDLREGTWSRLPAPDVLLLRTPGNPLPGWSRDTAGLWVAERRDRVG